MSLNLGFLLWLAMCVGGVRAARHAGFTIGFCILSSGVWAEKRGLYGRRSFRCVLKNRGAIDWEYSGQSENTGKAALLESEAAFLLRDGGGGLNPLSDRLPVRFVVFNMCFECELEFFGRKAGEFFFFFFKKIFKTLDIKKRLTICLNHMVKLIHGV